MRHIPENCCFSAIILAHDKLFINYSIQSSLRYKSVEKNGYHLSWCKSFLLGLPMANNTILLFPMDFLTTKTRALYVFATKLVVSDFFLRI